MQQQQFIDFLTAQMEQMRNDLAAMEGTLKAITRMSRDILPLLPKPDLPKQRTAPAPRNQRKSTTPVQIPEGVSADTTLEPDYTISDVPLYFTDRERLLFDTLNEAAEGKTVSREKLMEGAGLTTQPLLYATLRELKEKLEPARCTIINQHGVGYRLQQD